MLLSAKANKKRKQRRSRVEMDRLRSAIYQIAEAEQPTGDRHVFYKLLELGLIGKTEAEYKATVVRLLGEMREGGVLPWEWITDGSRLLRKPRSYTSLKAAIEETMLCGGSPSKAFLRNAAKEIEAEGKPAFLYYLGDFDPSGVTIRDRVERDLRRYAPAAQIEFTHLAVTEEQIAAYRLPTRPTKKTDPNAKKFGDRESVDVDAMPSTALREMVDAAIAQHIDPWELQQIRREEDAQRETGEMVLRNWDRALAAVGAV